MQHFMFHAITKANSNLYISAKKKKHPYKPEFWNFLLNNPISARISTHKNIARFSHPQFREKLKAENEGP